MTIIKEPLPDDGRKIHFYDGFGEYATDTVCSNAVIHPSDVLNLEVDLAFTHVMWYNK